METNGLKDGASEQRGYDIFFRGGTCGYREGGGVESEDGAKGLETEVRVKMAHLSYHKEGE